MLTLYYSPGACSLVSHIALEEAGADYKAAPILTSKNEQLSEAYLKINPHGRVPALKTDEGVLTENVAILSYMARTHPSAGLLPKGAFEESTAISMLGFYASSVHVAFGHFARPYRYTADEAGYPEIKDKGRESFFDYCKEMDQHLAQRQWVLDEHSACDGYPFLFYRWGARADLPMASLRNLARHQRDMVERPAVRRALEQEGLSA